jgi:hypothetical protein
MSPARPSLVLYAGPDHPIRPPLEARLRPLVRSQSFHAYRTLSGLTRRLRRPGGLRTDLVVLCPASVDELEALKQIRPLLISTHRIVLILPDHASETVAAGHAFYPRYIGFADGDLKDVVAVLERLLARSGDGPGTGRSGEWDSPGSRRPE